MKEKKKHKVFIQGAISPGFIADAIAKHSTKTTIGAHDIFLGQVRNDSINGKLVQAIDYTTYEEMAEEKIHEIREGAFEKFNLSCMHIYHSLGTIKAGEICLFVFVSSQHRTSAFDACRWIVEEIKANVPIWGKEVFEDETFQWKKNTETNIKYQKASENDLNQIKILATNYKLDTSYLEPQNFITAKLNEEIVGFGRLKQHHNFDEISTMGVLDSFRGRGIGKELVKQLLNQTSKKVYLATVIPLFFQKLGFFNTNEVPASLMEKIEQCHSKCNCEKIFILTK